MMRITVLKMADRSVWGPRRPRRGKLAFQPVGHEAPHRLDGQLAPQGPPEHTKSTKSK